MSVEEQRVEELLHYMHGYCGLVDFELGQFQVHKLKE